MNTERIDILIGLLSDDKYAHLFNMADWGDEEHSDGFVQMSEVFDGTRLVHDCPSVGCLAGWTIALWGASNEHGEYDFLTNGSYSLYGAELLNIDPLLGYGLFMPNAGKPYSEITREEAIGALQRLKDGVSGEELWDHVRLTNVAE